MKLKLQLTQRQLVQQLNKQKRDLIMTESMIKELTMFVWANHKDWSLKKAKKYVIDNYVNDKKSYNSKDW